MSFQLERTCKEQEDALAKEREANAVLRDVLEERLAELDATRKKLNREVPLNGLLDSSSSGSIPESPSKKELASARDEIKGLKYVFERSQAVQGTNSTVQAHRQSVADGERWPCAEVQGARVGEQALAV